jgi:hypothetical protein
MEMERRDEQSISSSMSRVAEKATSAVTNRVKDDQSKTWLQELAKREPNMFAHWALGWKP